jgi:hypothetical protein
VSSYDPKLGPQMGNTSYGWTCSICHQWVSNGIPHRCWSGLYPSSYPQPQPLATRTDWTPQLIALGNRIADLLERLVVALEKDDGRADQ